MQTKSPTSGTTTNVQGVRIVTFSDNFAYILNKWIIPKQNAALNQPLTVNATKKLTKIIISIKNI